MKWHPDRQLDNREEATMKFAEVSFTPLHHDISQDLTDETFPDQQSKWHYASQSTPSSSRTREQFGAPLSSLTDRHSFRVFNKMFFRSSARLFFPESSIFTAVFNAVFSEIIFVFGRTFVTSVFHLRYRPDSRTFQFSDLVRAKGPFVCRQKRSLNVITQKHPLVFTQTIT